MSEFQYKMYTLIFGNYWLMIRYYRNEIKNRNTTILSHNA